MTMLLVNLGAHASGRRWHSDALWLPLDRVGEIVGAADAAAWCATHGVVPRQHRAYRRRTHVGVTARELGNAMEAAAMDRRAKVLAERLRALPVTDRDGWVYFIQAANGGPIKIGWARDPEARRIELQTGHPVELVLLGAMRGARTTEARVHAAFVWCRERGEWFRPERALLGFVRAATTARS